jgi:hypothetical protein
MSLYEFTLIPLFDRFATTRPGFRLYICVWHICGRFRLPVPMVEAGAPSSLSNHLIIRVTTYKAFPGRVSGHDWLPLLASPFASKLLCAYERFPMELEEVGGRCGRVYMCMCA